MKASLALLTLAVSLLAVPGSLAVRPPAESSETPPLAGFPSTKKDPAARCTCGDARSMSGWCERQGIGYVADVKIRSWLLFEMMDAHGHAVDIGSGAFQCPECQKAIHSDGFCEEHRIGFVGKQAYFSRLTFELARADPVDPRKIACPVCRMNARGHGWCEAHQTGMVNNLAILGRERYQHVLKAIEILEIANKASERCEHCAMAIVTDSRCPFHKITYKDGNPLPAPSATPASASDR